MFFHWQITHIKKIPKKILKNHINISMKTEEKVNMNNESNNKDNQILFLYILIYPINLFKKLSIL